MTRTPVQSSNIKSVGYDADSQRMHVEFASGAVHEYAPVPPRTHAALMGAASIGTHFHEHIRNGGFSQKRLATPAGGEPSGSAQSQSAGPR